MTKNVEILYNDLIRIGIKNGDVILVHTSIKGLKKDGLKAEEIIDALLLAIGENGTLLVPALSYSFVTDKNPVFDVNSTKTCIGMLPEVFRTKYAEYRSIHPTHSVCAKGRLAEVLTKNHYKDNTPVGENSPFRLLNKYNGKILMLGCGLKPFTYMHGVEEIMELPYELSKTTQKYSLITDNKAYEKEYYPHEFGGLVQRYDRLYDVMKGYYSEGKALNGEAFLFNAEDVLKFSCEKLKENAYYFVEGNK